MGGGCGGGGGGDSGFGVREEEEAREWRREACESRALGALEGAFGSSLQDAGRRLCAEMGFRTQCKFGAGLADELSSLLQKLGETGVSPLELVPDPRAAIEDDGRARRGFERALADLRAAFSEAGRDAPPF